MKVKSYENIHSYIDGKRIEKDLTNINKYGALEGGGVSRLALTEEDMLARKYLIEEMEKLGLDVRVDAVGNIFGRREGETSLAPVLIGSHLDTVPNGGRYDGTVGVVASLEIIRSLNDAGMKTKRPIEIVNFTAEESSRFNMATIGSKAIAGKLSEEKLKEMKDKEGISFYDALIEKGYHPEELSKSQLTEGQYHTFIELHIEQGRVLETYEETIGVVEAIAAPTRYKVTVTGRQDHSGNTPMNMRYDALTAASELILEIENIARNYAGEHTVATVGYIEAKPGAMNVIPGEVNFLLDIRDIINEDKEKAIHILHKKVEEIQLKREVSIEMYELSHDKAVSLSPKIVNLLNEIKGELNYKGRIMPSGAGHDAMNLVPFTDVGMIFIPCKDGISHNIHEYSSLEDIVAGTKVMCEAVLKLSMEE